MAKIPTTEQLEAKVDDLETKLKATKKDLTAVKKTARDADVARLELIETRKKLDAAQAKVKRLKADLKSKVEDFEELAGIAFKKSIDPRQKTLPFKGSHEDVGPDNEPPPIVEKSTAKGRIDRDNIPLTEVVAMNAEGTRQRRLKAEWIATLNTAAITTLHQLRKQIGENQLKNVDGLERSSREAIITTVELFDSNRKEAETANAKDKRLNDQGFYFQGYNTMEVIAADHEFNCPIEIRTVEGADGLWRAGSIVHDKASKQKQVRPMRVKGITSRTQNEAIFREGESIRTELTNGQAKTKRRTEIANAVSAWVGELTAAKK